MIKFIEVIFHLKLKELLHFVNLTNSYCIDYTKKMSNLSRKKRKQISLGIWIYLLKNKKMDINSKYSKDELCILWPDFL